MEIKLAKNVFGDLEIESSEFLRIYEPKRFEGKGLSDTHIDRSIKTPMGTVPLSQMARGCHKVLIVTDDNTRHTPLDRILPPILGELKKAGVSKGDITFLIGLGTHRPMTNQEIRLKFGADIAGKYRIVNHEWNNPEALVLIGSCELGFEVVINKLVQDTDLLISVGSIVPHATAGFSGGGKSIMPGICGERTLEDTHWMALKYSMAEILGVHDNPIREAINSICKKVKLRLIVNTIMSNEDRIHGIVAGAHEIAHKRGSEICKAVYGVPIHEKADIVIAEAYPTDIDLRQAIKAICSADLVCRNGGVVILPAECREGVSPQFPEFAKYGFSDPEKLFRDVEQGNFPLKLMAYTLVAIGRIISHRIRAILVTPNISRSQIEEMGFLWAGDLQSAFDMALGMVGKDGKVAVMRQAGELLPLVNSIQ